MSDAPDNAAILDAIKNLDTKFDQKFDELKTADGHLTEEVLRQGRKIERIEQDVRDLKSDTERKITDERIATNSTMEAAMKHFDASAKAFHDKAAKIDAIEAKTDDQTTKLETIEKKTDAQTQILNELLTAGKSFFKNPFVRALGVAIATALAAKYGIKVLP